MSIKSRIRKHTAKNDSLIRELLANPLFRITQDGEVFTRINTNGIGLIPNEFWRRCDIDSGDGYRILNISIERNGRRKKKQLRVHRIVFQKFNGELNHKMVINHKDGNKANNKPDNLEQIEPVENTYHALETLGHNPIRNTVITFEIAEEIRKLNKEGISYNKLKIQFNLSKGHISQIVNYKIWNERAKYEAERDSPMPF